MDSHYVNIWLKPWETIHKKTDENYFKESKKFTDYFIQRCKTKPNESHNIKYYLNKKIKLTYLENFFSHKFCWYD